MRIWEIDAWRSLALCFMIFFHILVDLRDLFSYPIDYHQGFWRFTGVFSAVSFILLAGISSTFSHSPVRHSLRILLAATAVSVGTWWWDPDTYVRFGILHLLGVSMLSAASLKRLPPPLVAALALGSAALPFFLPATASTPWLLPFGITPPIFTTLDYYPLFPWYGLFVAGHWASRILYAEQRSLLPQPPGLSRFLWLGQHTLAIYLLHQPLLVALLTLWHK
jgi:uncharacterized membrane protein